MSTKKRLLNILFWSVISAAFIGPGTVTTAASSGASYGSALLWALLFSTLACLFLQEASARISIVTGKNLGESIYAYFENSRLKTPVLLLVLGAILVGAAAYEMGNLLGAVEGLKLFFELPSYLLNGLCYWSSCCYTSFCPLPQDYLYSSGYSGGGNGGRFYCYSRYG